MRASGGASTWSLPSNSGDRTLTFSSLKRLKVDAACLREMMVASASGQLIRGMDG